MRLPASVGRAGQGARRPGKANPPFELPGQPVVEAICAGSAEQLSAAVAEMLAVSEREGQTQFDFGCLLETIIGDSRIGDNSESYLDVKTRLGEAVLGSMDFASLGERVSEILLGMRQSGGEAKKSQEAVVAEMEQYLTTTTKSRSQTRCLRINSASCPTTSAKYSAGTGA